MNIDSAHNQRAFARIVALAWSSDDFKAALLQDPARVLREHGMALPEGARISLRDEGAAPAGEGSDLDLTIPARPGDLADVPITSRTSSAYLCGSRASFAEDAVQLAIPARPEDLADVPIVSRTSSAFISSRASFTDDVARLGA